MTYHSPRLLVLFAILSLPLGSRSQDSLLIAESVAKWQNSMAYLLEIAALMPDDAYGFKPTEEEMSFGQQLQHIAQNMVWLSTAYLKDGQPYVKDEKFAREMPPDSVRALLSESFRFALEALQQLDTRTLSDTKDFFAGPKTKRQIMHLMHDHVTHHRGQLIVYLRLKGLKPPKYRGW